MEQSQYVTGSDAIDIARLTGIQLHRQPARIGAEPDTDWKTAEFLVSAGATPDDFFIDLTRLNAKESADIILSLMGMWKAVRDYTGEVCP